MIIEYWSVEFSTVHYIQFSTVKAIYKVAHIDKINKTYMSFPDPGFFIVGMFEKFHPGLDRMIGAQSHGFLSS